MISRNGRVITYTAKRGNRVVITRSTPLCDIEQERSLVVPRVIVELVAKAEGDPPERKFVHLLLESDDADNLIGMPDGRPYSGSEKVRKKIGDALRRMYEMTDEGQSCPIAPDVKANLDRIAEIPGINDENYQAD